MRYLTGAVVGAAMSAGAAQAAVVDLTYTLSTRLVSADFVDNSPNDQEIGDLLTETFSVSFDTDDTFPIIRNDFALSERIADFDPITGAIDYVAVEALDIVREYNLAVDGTGSFNLSGTHPDNGIIASFTYDVIDFEVEGLPEVAPIPLPASLPLLGMGIAAVSIAARRRKATSKARAN